jgi:hypothetical protein
MLRLFIYSFSLFLFLSLSYAPLACFARVLEHTPRPFPPFHTSSIRLILLVLLVVGYSCCSGNHVVG